MRDAFAGLPTLERARAELVGHDGYDLIAQNPLEKFAAAAIVVQIDAIRREAWDDDVEISEALFSRYPRGAVPAPTIVREEREGPFSRTVSFKLIPDDAVGRRGPCSACAITKGKEICAQCGGRGVSGAEENLIPCSVCNGSGMITCSACDGTTITVSTKVRYINDHPVNQRRAFVPNIGKIAPFVAREIDASAAWSPLYAFDPQPQVVASAYRGASAAREPDFHGFHFGDALPRALEAISGLAGAAAQETRCFAVPLLWLVYGSNPLDAKHVVITARPDGSITTVCM